jgi:hypothetical protein
VELACVRDEHGSRIAIIHVPEDQLNYFVKRVERYLTERSASGRPKHQELVERIAAIRLVSLRSFWTDEGTDFPSGGEAIWWEVWLRAESDQSPWDTFRLLAHGVGLQLGEETIRFPDRVVGLCRGTASQLSSTVEILDLLAEVRKAKENPADFVEMTPQEQAAWVNNLRQHLQAPAVDSPAVCVLDGGVMAQHPLIQPALAPADALRYDPAWPLTDARTHGTEMAGIALFGSELTSLLQTTGPVPLRHRLESVKILSPPPGQNDPNLYGAITAQAVYRIETQAPTRPRAFCMAVTTDGRDRGLPSSWSGEVDQLCAGVGDGHRRLLFVSAGNIDAEDRHRYPDANDIDPIQDPGQAWNAVTVGAYTEIVQFPQTTYPDWRPLAAAGGLSPSSTTSLIWNRDWPLKPDLVLEGGNAIISPDKRQTDTPEQMSLLTTAHATGGRLLVAFGDTSAATAQAARMAAILQAEYPSFWPETIRGLLVHSAEWTSAMQSAFGGNRQGAHDRLRRYGFGVPNLRRAQFSARSSLTLIVQEALRPYDKVGNDIKFKDMHLHNLPWPINELQKLGERNATMRVTLSYFIEPSPGRRGWTRRHRYQSFGLRFDVKRPEESVTDFRQRLSRAARDEEDDYGGAIGTPGDWMLGPRLRTRGSIHSDWWTGMASQLAACGHIAVYPVSGWWKERPKQDCWSRIARYSLVVSITTAETGIDLYTPVAVQVQPVVTEVEIEDGS